MAIRKKEYELVFDRGLVTNRAPSGYGSSVVPVALDNAWLLPNDLGGIGPVYGTDAGVYTASTGNPVHNLTYAISKSGNKLQVLHTSQSQAFEYKIFSSTYTSSTTNAVVKTWPSFPTGTLGSIVVMDDTQDNKRYFWHFNGVGGQFPHLKIEAGTTTSSNVGLIRPDTTENDDIYLAVSTGGENNVKGVVRYWIAQAEDGDESALSLPIRRQYDIPYALSFDGTNDSVNWDSVSAFNISGTDTKTVEVLVRKDAAPTANEFVFGRRNNLTPTTAGWSLHVNTAGKVLFIVDDGVDTKSLTSRDSICDGEWHRISGVYNGNTSMTLYRDGEQESTITTSSIGIFAFSTDMTAGENASGTNDFTGALTDFRFWSDVRTQGEIKAVARTSLSGAEDNLAGYWPADESSGSTLTDASPSSNDGTIAGASWESIVQKMGAKSVNCGTGSRVTITFAATRFHGLTFKIYRTGANGSQPFYLADFTPVSGSTVYTDDTEDIDLGDVPYLHGDEPPDESLLSLAHFNRLFVSVGSRLYWSDLASLESFWTGTIGNWLDIFPEDGDSITALARDQDGLIIFKSAHMYRLVGRVPSEFTLKELTLGGMTGGGLGTPGQHSFCYIPGGVAFYHLGRVFLYVQNSFQRISLDIENSLKADFGINPSFSDTNITMAYYASRDQLWLADPGNSDKTYIYDTRRGQWISRLSDAFYSLTDIVGYYHPSGLANNVLMGGGAGSDGFQLYQMDDDATPSNAFAGSNFSVNIELSPFTGDDMNELKRFLYVDFVFDFETLQGGAGQFVVTPSIDDVNLSATTISVTSQSLSRRRVNIGQVGRQLEIKMTNTPATHGRPRWYSMTYGYQTMLSPSTL